MWSDIRATWRGLRRSPASAAAVVVTLALALGVGTALYAVFERTVLGPPPFDIDSLTLVGAVPPSAPDAALRPVGISTLRAWRTTASHLAHFEAYDPTNVTLTGAGHPTRLSVTAATPGLLPMLGVTPQIGRGFSDHDAAVTVVSHAFWQDTLRANSDVLGRTLVLNGVPFTIVGVLPESFTFPLNRSDLWIRLASSGADATPVRVLARLANGTSSSLLAARLEHTDETRVAGSAIATMPLTVALRTSAHTALPLLLASAALCVLLTTTNVANLLLLRGMDRSRELIVRSALGASRLGLVRHTWVETAVLVSAGAIGGALLAMWLIPVAAQLAESQLGTPVAGLTMNWRAVAVLAAMTACCIVAAAIAPTAAALRTRPLVCARASITASLPELKLRRAFVAVEVTLAFVLVTAMLMVGNSLQRMTAVDPGFASTGTLTARLSLPAATYPDARSVSDFYRALHEALTARLGQETVALIDELPLTGNRGRGDFSAGPSAPPVDAVTRTAGPGYFDVLEIALRRGRTFTPADDHNAPPRIVVSLSFAREAFGNDDVVGRTVVGNGLPMALQIVGVVNDVKHHSLDERDLPTVYVSAAQQPSRSMHVVVRGSRSLPAGDAIDLIRAEVARRDAALPLYAVRSLDDVVKTSPGVPLRRVVSASFSAFALLSFAIAMVGVFGAIAHDVRRRGREIALRLALGADATRVRQHVVIGALALLAPGLLAGATLSVALSQSLRPVLFGVGPTDVSTLLLVGILLTTSTLVAVTFPARQAARTDPADLLRGE